MAWKWVLSLSCGRTDLPYLPNGINTVHQVVVDLDGTIARGVFPLRGVIGEPISEGVALLKHYAEEGYSICIYTARPEWDRDAIIAWVKKHKLPVDKIVTDKPVAALYLDDRSWNPWREELRKRRK